MINTQHTIAVTVKNEAGALSRIVNLFSGRGYNIESLTVATAPDSKYAKSTIVVSNCDEKVIEQIVKQLYKLIPVTKVVHTTSQNSISKELVLIKVEAKAQTADLIKILEHFDSKIIGVTSKTCIIQSVCDEKQLQSLLEFLKPLGIKEVVRSGIVSIQTESLC